MTILVYIGAILALGLVVFMGYQVISQLRTRKKKTGRYKR